MLLVLATLCTQAQTTTEADAFSNSYAHESNKEYAAAIADINAVYSEGSYAQNLRLGWLYYMQGEYLKSQNHYKKAKTLSPTSVEARIGYVYPTAAMENWDDVIKTYLSILEIDPRNTTANYRLGYIYYVRKDFSQASKYTAAVLALYPFDYDANVLLGRVMIAQGKIVEAKGYLQTALLYSPSSKEVQELLKNL